MYSKNVKLLAIALFLISGTISTFGTSLLIIAYKLQGSITVKQGEHQKKFFHPYMQAFSMFIGESLCLLLYFYYNKTEPTPLEEGKTAHKIWIFIIPAMADSCSSMLQYMGLSFISGSTYQMFKGASIVTTAIFSKILFNMKLQKRHFVGCGLAILGIVIVGSSSFIQSNSSGDTTFDQQFVGYILMLVSLVFNGFFYAYQQFLLRKHSINPMQMVGWEGIFGMIIILIITTILSFIPCHFSDKACVFNEKNEAFIELPLVFTSELFQHIWLFIMMVLGLTSLAVYNFNGLKITKMFDALTRSLLNITKTSVIWIVGIVITLATNGNPDYKIESLNVGVSLVKAVGFGVIIFGTLIYNKLILKKYFAPQENQEQFIKNYASITSSSESGSLVMDKTPLIINKTSS